MVDTYRARRRLEMAPGVWREPGELVPEAVTWFRRDAFLHTGYITDTKVDEPEFVAAVQQFCPGQAEQVLAFAGVTADLEGPRHTPRKRARSKQES